MAKIAVLTFPGNNCEHETARAAKRNGFNAEILRWSDIEKIKNYEAYILPGGFSFEDRGRSGVLASREKIFDALRNEAKKGKLILGICNGAQMVVESGLIPVGKNPLPFALAKNVRRNKHGHVLGTGFYNAWIYVKAERKNTAFTNQINQKLALPIAHGEGRFETIDSEAKQKLKSGEYVAFRYCDEAGYVSEKFPITPNGAQFATAGIVNKEGTIMAFMPHPERFFDNFDGDHIFQSMKKWIEEKRSPEYVKIGDFTHMEKPIIKKFERRLSNAINKHPNYADLWNNLGVVHLIQCRNLFLQALNEFDKALEINPSFNKALKNKKLVENDGKEFLILLRAILR